MLSAVASEMLLNLRRSSGSVALAARRRRTVGPAIVRAVLIGCFPSMKLRELGTSEGKVTVSDTGVICFQSLCGEHQRIARIAND